MSISLKELDNKINNIETQVSGSASFKNGSNIFMANEQSLIVVDSFITSNTLITVIPKDEKQGDWSVESGEGNFTITSTSIEPIDVSFDWGGVK